MIRLQLIGFAFLKRHESAGIELKNKPPHHEMRISWHRARVKSALRIISAQSSEGAGSEVSSIIAGSTVTRFAFLAFPQRALAQGP
jgi:hypothetical protein